MSETITMNGQSFEVVAILTLENKNEVLLTALRSGHGIAKSGFLPLKEENRHAIGDAIANDEVLGFVLPDGRVKYLLPDDRCLPHAEQIATGLDASAQADLDRGKEA